MIMKRGARQIAILGDRTRKSDMIKILKAEGAFFQLPIGIPIDGCVYYIDTENYNFVKIRSEAPEGYVVYTVDEYLKQFNI